MFVIDAENGAVHNKLAVERMGNPLAVESQLMLASGDRVDAYMSFSKADACSVIESPRLPASPSRPCRCCGWACASATLALEAADLAMQSINRLGAADPTNRQAAASRGELFTLLLELAAAKMNGTVAEGESVYAMVVAVAADPQQRIEYLLAYGDWLREHALHQAVELSVNPLRSRAGRLVAPDQGTMRPASAWAAQRLASLIEQRGGWSTPRKPTTRPCASNKQWPPPPIRTRPAVPWLEFPFSEAAIEAALSAAAVHMNRGDARQALADLIAVHHAAAAAADRHSPSGGVRPNLRGNGVAAAGSLLLTHIIRALATCRWRPVPVNAPRPARTPCWMRPPPSKLECLGWG